MLEILLYTSLTCEDSAKLMLRIAGNDNLAEPVKVELVETVKASAPECSFYWDAND